jgi:hypothetical protein
VVPAVVCQVVPEAEHVTASVPDRLRTRTIAVFAIAREEGDIFKLEHNTVLCYTDISVKTLENAVGKTIGINEKLVVQHLSEKMLEDSDGNRVASIRNEGELERGAEEPKEIEDAFLWLHRAYGKLNRLLKANVAEHILELEFEMPFEGKPLLLWELRWELALTIPKPPHGLDTAWLPGAKGIPQVYERIVGRLEQRIQRHEHAIQGHIPDPVSNLVRSEGSISFEGCTVYIKSELRYVRILFRNLFSYHAHSPW